MSEEKPDKTADKDAVAMSKLFEIPKKEKSEEAA